MTLPVFLAHGGTGLLAWIVGLLLSVSVLATISLIAALLRRKGLALTCGLLGLSLATLMLRGSDFRLSTQIDSVVPWLASLLSSAGIALALLRREKPGESPKPDRSVRGAS